MPKQNTDPVASATEPFAAALVNQRLSGDDIPFGQQSGEGPVSAAPAVSPAKEHLLRDEIKALKAENESLRSDLSQAEEEILRGKTQARLLFEGKALTSKEVFLAIVTGMASTGDFNVGSGKLQNDDAVRNAARHCAGIAQFFYQAAKDARIV